MLSLLLTSHPGSVISNAPKNDAAKTMNTRKKITFGIQCVASQLKISAVTASPPTSFVIRMITAIGSVYSATMHTPYKAAIRRPRARFPLPFRKNDTVIGIIGNTQGVSSAANPHRIASIIALHSVPPPTGASGCNSGCDTAAESASGTAFTAVSAAVSVVVISPACATADELPVAETGAAGVADAPPAAVCTAAAFRGIEKVRSAGGRQLSSSQAIHSTTAFSVVSRPGATRTF